MLIESIVTVESKPKVKETILAETSFNNGGKQDFNFSLNQL